jgi:hypothetical protein
MGPPLRWLSVYFAAVITGGSLVQTGETRYPIDVSKSTVRFSIEHVFAGRVTGSVPLQSGFVVLGAHSLVRLQSAPCSTRRALIPKTRIKPTRFAGPTSST